MVTDPKPTPLLEQKKSVIFWFQWDKLFKFDIDVEVGQTVHIIDGAFADYTGKLLKVITTK